MLFDHPDVIDHEIDGLPIVLGGQKVAGHALCIHFDPVTLGEFKTNLIVCQNQAIPNLLEVHILPRLGFHFLGNRLDGLSIQGFSRVAFGTTSRKFINGNLFTSTSEKEKNKHMQEK